jgi:two-component system CheB/CheR fusion protein
MREAVQDPISARLYEKPQTPGINLHFEELVNASPVAIYTCDAQGYITYYNPAAVNLWGREPKLGEDLW